MQRELRLLDHDQRRGRRIEQDREQHQVAQRAIGQAVRRDLAVTFDQVELQRSAFGHDFDVVEAGGDIFDQLEQPSLDRWRALERGDSGWEILEVLEQGIGRRVGPTRGPKRAQRANGPMLVDTRPIEVLAESGALGK
jgi:hypothetical protein